MRGLKNNMEEKVYNETYNDTVHKYTLNLPKENFARLKKKAYACGIKRVSIYLNALIDRDLNSDPILTIQDIISARRESIRIASADHRRENLSKYDDTWMSLRIKKVLNIFQPRQHIFDFKNNS